MSLKEEILRKCAELEFEKHGQNSVHVGKEHDAGGCCSVSITELREMCKGASDDPRAVSKSIETKENPDSIEMTWRANKDGKLACTGFDCKCYGSSDDILILAGKIRRMVELGKKIFGEAEDGGREERGPDTA
jgi:hypothetical protein